ncbi:photosynthetic NDH subunit of lumenal location 3, chloroplastic [Cynara cardunculus var. scolymus]|uniref:photosynthetic NDH subunit of lumenal location 3, chloroplastic n=1 Tax=Cynara cardunculus var. scolymus TaxID=59895 RepID=UPI000D62F6E1|nr:photosynthetic NDH subunit of lumenal location 3, chloroplastic [Cynara cardunculus var. scolymus]
MAPTANLNQIFTTFPAIPKLSGEGKLRSDAAPPRLAGNKVEESQNQPLKPTRRLALGLGSIGLFANSNVAVSLAEDNGFWLTGPIPIPRASNMIDNVETGTRSFLKTGVYIADIGTKGRAFRLKKYAFDLLALGDLIGKDAWNYVRKYLRLKSTFMYFDFDKVISAATPDDKPPLLDLANRLFDSVEKLEVAVKNQDLPQTELLYSNTTVILEEVMTKMA